ncbi:MAG: MFS transporter [Microbacterium sp.]
MALPARTAPRLGVLASVVGLLAFVEFTSGVMQGYYSPLMTDIARHLGVHDADMNWLEGAQLMLAALVVPAFAKLGDMVGHKRMLLIAIGIATAASFVLPLTTSFPVFLVAWAIQGFNAVWLPLEIALVWSRSRARDAPAGITAKAAGVLVAALELGAISGALVGGALIDALPLAIVLLVPAIIMAACFVVVLFGVPASRDVAGGRLDSTGLVLVSVALIVFTGGLFLLRASGPGAPLPWIAVIVGLALFVPFVLAERRQADPLIDVRMFADPALWPVFLTAGLFGMSVLGAQVPLSTFARTDPAIYGYGLGTAGFTTSLIIGLYLIAMIAGALLYSVISRRLTPRLTLVGASVLVGIGYLLFLPSHASYLGVVANMVIAGIGSGALVAALPSAAAAAAPATQTGVATGLTNSVKTVGGAIASCIFGIALASGASAAADATAGSFSGYVAVWLVCGITALVAAGTLLLVPREAFTDRR